jgi:hypothetical protein
MDVADVATRWKHRCQAERVETQRPEELHPDVVCSLLRWSLDFAGVKKSTNAYNYLPRASGGLGHDCACVEVLYQDPFCLLV